MTVEEPRDASGQAEIRVQIPLCLQMLNDDIGDSGWCFIVILINVYYLRAFFVLQAILFEDTSLFKNTHRSSGPTILSHFLCFHEALKKTEQGRSTE